MGKRGGIIQELRVKAGFTQKTLAEALHITDKAVSKWERGICLPDVTLLPKLSLLLDTDVEVLISKSIENENWVGLIDIHGCNFAQMVHDKPLVYYILCHFLLLGIRDIYVLTEEENHKYLESEVFETLGFRFFINYPPNNSVMIVNHRWFVFGSDLTQQFQGAMLSNRNSKLVLQHQEPVFYFMRKPEQYHKDPFGFYETAAPKTLGRGMVCVNMEDNEKILDVALFVKMYQKNSGLLIASLEEIAYRKGIISKQQLIQLAKEVSYWPQLVSLIQPQVG